MLVKPYAITESGWSRVLGYLLLIGSGCCRADSLYLGAAHLPAFLKERDILGGFPKACIFHPLSEAGKQA